MERKYKCKGFRKMADGTVKEYTYEKTYYATIVRKKLTDDEKELAWKRYLEGVKVKKICEELNSTHPTVKKAIDKKKKDMLEAIPNV